MTRFSLATMVAALLASLLPASAPRAQTPVFDVARLDALFESPPKVEVNLRGSLLRLALAEAESEVEGAGESARDALRGLRSIIVRVYALDAARAGLSGHLAGLEAEMAATGWTTLVRVRPDDEDADDVWVYVREAGDAFDGMAVLSLDHDEGDASFVFIDGPIDPAHVGSLGGRFGVQIGDEDGETDADARERARIDADDVRIQAEDARIEAEEARIEAEEERREARDEARRERDEAYRERDAAREEARTKAERARRGQQP